MWLYRLGAGSGSKKKTGRHDVRHPTGGVRRPSLLALATLCACAPADDRESASRPASTLQDLSGLAWVADSLFVAVHDSKLPHEGDRPRISFVWIGASPAGPAWRPLQVRWPRAGASSDLESAALVPGTRTLLLAESGDDGSPFRRIFPATLEEDAIRVGDPVPWPVEVVNVEGTAVARAGDRLVFLFAERSHGSASTWIRWAPLRTAPLGFGAFQGAPLTLPADAGMNRPVSALEVDSGGWIYVASTFDPDVDDGPFRSTVWRVGRVTLDGAGEPVVAVDSARLIARADGMKIESLAVRELADGGSQLVMGSDDENLGAVIRPLPLAAQRAPEGEETGGRR